MRESKMRFRIGLFVLASLILLAGLIYMFGNFPHLFRSSEGQLYTVLFRDAPGIESGTPVRRSGVKIGEVEKVELDDETGEVTVILRVESGYTLRRSDDANLTSNLLSGDTSIDFLPKDLEEGQEPDRRPMDPAQPIRGNAPTNVNRLLAKASEVVPPAQKALDEMQKSLKRLETLSPQINATVEEYRKLAADVRAAIPDIQKTNKELQGLMQDTRKAMPDFQNAAKEIQGLSSDVRKAVPDFQNVAKDVGSLTKEIQTSVPEFREAIKDTRKLIQSVTEVVPTVKETLTDIRVTARNWGNVGERVNVFLATNDEKLNKIVDNAVKTAEGASKLFGDENVQNVRTVLGNFVTASKSFPDLSRNANNLFLEGREFLRELEPSTKTLNETLKNFRDLTDPDSGDGKGLLKSVTKAADQLNSLLADVQAIVKAAAKGDGTLQRLLTDPALFNHLDDAALMITRVMPRMDRILKDFEIFADKVARHPEKIGLGGLVRPDSGLKNSPFRRANP